MTAEPRENPRVHFVDVRNQYIEPRCNSVDKSALFYSKMEYTLMERRNKAIVERMQSHAVSGDCCTRGLESRPFRFARRRAMNRQRAWAATLDEQSRQRMEGILDPYLLAEIYQGFTRHCACNAFKIGTRDAEAARAIHDDEEPCATTSTEISSSSSSSNSEDVPPLSIPEAVKVERVPVLQVTAVPSTRRIPPRPIPSRFVRRGLPVV